MGFMGLWATKMDWFANGQKTQVVDMSRFDQQFVHEHEEFEPLGRKLAHEDDLTMEEILENLNHTPIGQVLKRIASMPEVRRDKVLDVRQRLSRGDYHLNDRLDETLERVLEDLKT